MICHAYHHHHPHFGCCLWGSRSFTTLRVLNGPSLPLVLNDIFCQKWKECPPSISMTMLSQEAWKNTVCTLDLIQKQLFHFFLKVWLPGDQIPNPKRGWLVYSSPFLIFSHLFFHISPEFFLFPSSNTNGNHINYANVQWSMGQVGRMKDM